MLYKSLLRNMAFESVKIGDIKELTKKNVMACILIFMYGKSP